MNKRDDKLTFQSLLSFSGIVKKSIEYKKNRLRSIEREEKPGDSSVRSWENLKKKGMTTISNVKVISNKIWTNTCLWDLEIRALVAYATAISVE